MRINFIMPPDSLSGGVRVLAIYAERLARRGHEVAVIQPRNRKPTWREIARSVRRSGKWPRSFDSGPSYFDGIDQRVWRLRLKHEGPITAADVPDGDIALATWWESAEWAWSLPRSKGIKAHFMQDYEIWGQGPEGVERVDATCRMPIPKIVIAQWVWNLLESRFGQVPVALISNSVDTAHFRAPPRGKQPVPTVGFCYTPMRNKGTDISLAAIELARKQVPDLKVMAFGSLSPSKELPLPKGAEFFFRVPDRELPSLYASCDAWLFGTRIEGFGLPILEAMACRTPVIGTPAGAAPELLAQGGGMLVPMEDPAAMAEALVHLCLLPQHRWKEYSDAALATATGYTWEDATDRLESALVQIYMGAAGGTSGQGRDSDFNASPLRRSTPHHAAHRAE